MKLIVEVESEDAQATDDPLGLSQLVLRNICKLIERGVIGGNLHDINGNKIGSWSLEYMYNDEEDDNEE